MNLTALIPSPSLILGKIIQGLLPFPVIPIQACGFVLSPIYLSHQPTRYATRGQLQLSPFLTCESSKLIACYLPAPAMRVKGSPGSPPQPYLIPGRHVPDDSSAETRKQLSGAGALSPRPDSELTFYHFLGAGTATGALWSSVIWRSL